MLNPSLINNGLGNRPNEMYLAKISGLLQPISNSSQFPSLSSRKNGESFVISATVTDSVTSQTFHTGDKIFWFINQWELFNTTTGEAPSGDSYLTINNELATLPNSRRFANGNITTLDILTSGQFKINVDQSLIDITASQVSDFTSAVDALVSGVYLPLSGGIMTGELDLASNIPLGTLDTTSIEAMPVGWGNLILKRQYAVLGTNNPLSGIGQVIDGVTITDGMKVFTRGQLQAFKNGGWIASAGSWTRSPEFINGTSQSQLVYYITGGTTNANTIWRCSFGDVVGTGIGNNLTFVLFQSSGIYTGTNGVTVSGSVISLTPLTANKALVSSSAGLPTTSSSTDQQVAYLTPIPDLSNSLNRNRLIYTAIGGLTALTAITANKALVSDGSGLPIASSVTNTEQSYLSGASSNIQTQINSIISGLGSYLPLAGGSMTGNITFANNLGIDSTSAGSNLYIGASGNAQVIGIGAQPGTVSISLNSDFAYVQKLFSYTKSIVVNEIGGAASGDSSGFEVHENGVTTGYFLVSSDRTGFDLKGCANSGTMTFTPSSGAFNLKIISSSTANRTLTVPDANSVTVISSNALSNQFANGISSSGVVNYVQPSFGNISGTASLTTQVTGVLPIANGGTNSSTTLVNNKLMISTSGAIKESSNFSINSDGGLVIATATNSNMQMGIDIALNSTSGNFNKAIHILQPSLPTTGGLTAGGVLQFYIGKSEAAGMGTELWFVNTAGGAFTNNSRLVLYGADGGLLWSRRSIALGNIGLDAILGRSGNATLDADNTIYKVESRSRNTSSVYVNISSDVVSGTGNQVGMQSFSSFDSSITDGENRLSYTRSTFESVSSGHATGKLLVGVNVAGTLTDIFSLNSAGLTVLSGSGSGITLLADATSALQAVTLQQVQGILGTKVLLTDTPVTSSGTTVTLTTPGVFLRVSGVQAVVTLVMPTSPSGGDTCIISSTNVVTTTNWSGPFVNGAPSTSFFLTANHIGFSYQSVVNAWLQIF